MLFLRFALGHYLVFLLAILRVDCPWIMPQKDTFHYLKQFHIVLETLDTEEATYIWHFDREAENFIEHIREIDSAITQLRSEGRQAYLDSKPENFYRILHDYSNLKKGFVSWKGQFEEKTI